MIITKVKNIPCYKGEVSRNHKGNFALFPNRTLFSLQYDLLYQFKIEERLATLKLDFERLRRGAEREVERLHRGL